MSALKPMGCSSIRTYNTAASGQRRTEQSRLSATTNELLRAFQSLRVLHYHERYRKCVTELVARESSLQHQHSVFSPECLESRIAHEKNKPAHGHAFPEKQPSKNHCSLAVKDNPDGMHLEFYLDETARKAICNFTLVQRYNRPSWHSHGGIIATILDEPWASKQIPQRAGAHKSMQIVYLQARASGQTADGYRL